LLQTNMAKKQKKIANKKVEDSSEGNEKLCAILSYLIIGIIWYLADEKMKKSETVKFHVKQGLVLLIAEIINGAIWSIPILGWIIAPIINIGLIIILIIGIINAASNQEKELPIIGKFAENFKF
jgi:uncharacterized membrane protein